MATQYYANVHPSIGNYFIMTTGVAYSTDDNFNGVVPIDNVVRELQAASKSWKVYAQSLPQQGYLGGDVYPYLRRHNPISYFSDVQPPSQLEPEHRGFLAVLDGFGGRTIARLLVHRSRRRARRARLSRRRLRLRCQRPGRGCRRLAVRQPASVADQFAVPAKRTAGLDDRRIAKRQPNGGGRVATVLLGTGVKAGYQGTVTYDHRSLLGLSMTALGVSTIPNGAGSAPQMTEFFQ